VRPPATASPRWEDSVAIRGRLTDPRVRGPCRLRSHANGR